MRNFWKSRPIAIALLAASVSLAGASDKLPGLANRWVLVIRHAEKPASGKGLSPEGEKRAKFYATYFTHFQINGKTLQLDELFATKDSKNSDRPRLTLTPLSQATHIPLDTHYANKEYGKLVKKLGEETQKSDLLICWHHGKIPDMLTSFGADPKKLLPGGKWPSDHFNYVIELHFDKTGEIIAKDSKRIVEPKL
jgi:hypothetical protein